MKGNATVEIATCPACKQKITGRATVEIGLSDASADGEITGAGKLVGVTVQHNCVPRVTRNSEKGCFS